MQICVTSCGRSVTDEDGKHSKRRGRAVTSHMRTLEDPVPLAVRGVELARRFAENKRGLNRGPPRRTPAPSKHHLGACR